MNIKKGQFLSPWDMSNVVDKARATGNQQIMVCERGVSFGYNNLVVRHALAGGHARDRLPGGVRCHAFGAVAGRPGHVSGGQREFVPVLARAAVAAGVAGLFMETHPDPTRRCATGRTPGRCDAWSRLLATLVRRRSDDDPAEEVANPPFTRKSS